MNKFLIVAVVLVATAAFGTAAIQTSIVTNPQALVVQVPTGRVLRILNFVGPDGNGSFASVTINAVTAEVMSATSYQSQETRIMFYVAGPATLTVQAGLTSVISYVLESNISKP